MLGYYHNEQATEGIIKIHKDGRKWLHTGDLGCVNENGVVFVTGRIKKILMTKGKDQQISQTVFLTVSKKSHYDHPAVDLCCVIGVPDEQRIHYPKAFIVLKQGVEESEQTMKSILEACKVSLPESTWFLKK